MSPLEIVQEWARGCSNASDGRPEECEECTRAMLDALHNALAADTRYTLTDAGRAHLKGREHG